MRGISIQADDSTAAPTSLNSWIWVCSNMENTLELAPSVLFLAFLGAWRGNKRTLIKSQKLEIRKLGQALSLGEPQLLLCEMGVQWPRSSQNGDAGGIKRHNMTFLKGLLVLVDHKRPWVLQQQLLETRRGGGVSLGMEAILSVQPLAESSRFCSDAFH